jgi:hypothetical protein
VQSLDRDQWPSDAGPVDAAIVGWGAYHSIRGRDRRVALLRAARSSLTQGAPILISFFTRRERTVYLRLVPRVGNVMRRLRRAGAIERGDTLAPVFSHHFTQREIAEELAEAGFRMVDFQDEGYGRAVGVADSS